MVYIFTALYCEAYNFIRQFHLTKKQENTCFQEFYNDAAGIRLTITGVGEIAAAAAVGSTCSVYRPAQDDWLLNVGICAHTVQNDGIFLCNKIVEKATGKTFYPDMLCRHEFGEGTIVTGMMPWHGEDNDVMMTTSASCGTMYDMEAAAVYQAGSRFFGPHQMIFLKVVSDKGVVGEDSVEDSVIEVSKEKTIHLMEKYQQSIMDYIGRISDMARKNVCQRNLLCRDGEKQIETFCADLHCSKTMRDFMGQYVRYMALSGLDYVSVIQEMYEQKLLPCKDKREGKLRFEEFKRRLF